MDKAKPVEGAEVTSTRELYDEWAATYDEMVNPTRDLEKQACEAVLGGRAFDTVIEVGGGTGKNTACLAELAKRLISVDLSPEMQAVARRKVNHTNVEFRTGDIRREWDFAEPADLITCSLILEHVVDLVHVFEQAAKTLKPSGRFYICELHPFKQYAGSKARFETENGLKVLDCFRHHVTEYSNAAMSSGFAIESMDEWFDENDRESIPRLISFVFSRNR